MYNIQNQRYTLKKKVGGHCHQMCISFEQGTIVSDGAKNFFEGEQSWNRASVSDQTKTSPTLSCNPSVRDADISTVPQL